MKRTSESKSMTGPAMNKMLDCTVFLEGRNIETWLLCELDKEKKNAEPQHVQKLGEGGTGAGEGGS